MVVELRPNQKKAVEELKNGMILKGDVGSGKSITSLSYYVAKEAPKDVYIITTAKKRDSLEWEKEAIKLQIGKIATPGRYGALHVDSWQNVERYQDVRGAFFIFDEQRLVGAGSWVKAFLEIAKHNTWIVLSATPGDVWLDYVPIFLANGFYKNRTEFTREHVVYSRFAKFPKVERYLMEPKLKRLRASITVEMPDVRHTKRHLEYVRVEHHQELLETVVKKRWHVYEDRPIRDVGEMFLVMRKVVNSDPDRLLKTEQLVRKHDKLIIFYNFNYELDQLRMLGQWFDIPMAEWNGHKHEDIPKTDKWIYLVQYTAGAEGWNCTETNAELFYSLNYSYKLFEQAQGRIDRMNTPFTDLQYYILLSDSMIDKAIMKALASKRAFNERRYWKRFEDQQPKAA